VVLLNKRICIFLLLIVVFLLQSSVFAAETGKLRGYGVSPMIIELVGKPGDILTTNVSVFNDKENPVQIAVDVRDFEKKNNQIIYRDDLPLSFSVNKWSSIKDNTLLLNGQTSKKVTIEVSIPEEAEMGEHASLIGIKFLSPNTDSTVSVTTEILPVFYVTVTDPQGNINLNRSWSILDFQADKLNGGSISFRVENTGNVHLESGGTLTVRNIFTNNIEKIPIPSINILPKDTKDIAAEWKPSEWFGLYEATAEIHFGDEKSDIRETKLYVIPWIPIVTFVLITALMIIGIRMYLTNLRKRIFAQAKREAAADKEKIELIEKP
jgi:hypothetical protein